MAGPIPYDPKIYVLAIGAFEGALIVTRFFIGKNMQNEHGRPAFWTRRTVDFDIR
jgi:hypothetical protein